MAEYRCTSIARAATLAVPKLLKEDMLAYQDDQNDDGKSKPAVCVIMDQESPLTSTSFKLTVEHELVCCFFDIVTAFACFVSAFYIFHLKYPPTHIKTLEFMQIALLDIEDKCPVEKPVLTLVSRLNKSM